MARRLPSLNALRAFEAAGRRLSFTEAARELNVSAAAVGQQIRMLEENLGEALFVRRHRAVELTDAGRRLLPSVSDAFERLHAAVDSLSRESAGRPLTVTVDPSFGARWLLGRLDRFRALYPGVEVRIDATRRVVDLVREQVDLAVRYGSGQYPGLRVDCLLSERVIPVCSPSLTAGRDGLREPADLQRFRLLRMRLDPRYATWPDWSMWLEAAGLQDFEPQWGPEFGGEADDLLIRAAIEGQGVALASAVLVADDLSAGRLVQPFEISFTMAFCYWVVAPRATADTARVRAFREWLFAEAGTMGDDATEVDA
jgi:LysR family transcriptional regulator, glycine cleavage system transcriptional activator